MRLAYDLHIHTALSPCSNSDMTPNNIVNMSLIKELDIIAITDHNSIANCKPCIEVAENKDIVVIPGMELQTKEEAHIICLFPSLEKANSFEEFVKSKQAATVNTPQIFGHQWIFDKEDRIIGEEEKMLITSINISIKEVFRFIQELGGLAFPAHVDRPTYSIISNLGFIPKNLPIGVVEISKDCNMTKILSTHPELKSYKIITNSDAHYLHDISERKNFIEVKEKNIEGILQALKNSIFDKEN